MTTKTLSDGQQIETVELYEYFDCIPCGPCGVAPRELKTREAAEARKANIEARFPGCSATIYRGLSESPRGFDV